VAPPAAPEDTLVLRTPAGLEAMLTGSDAPAVVAVLRGVLPPLARLAPGVT
jgi:hypothetical protein